MMTACTFDLYLRLRVGLDGTLNCHNAVNSNTAPPRKQQVTLEIQEDIGLDFVDFIDTLF